MFMVNPGGERLWECWQSAQMIKSLTLSVGNGPDT